MVTVGSAEYCHGLVIGGRLTLLNIAIMVDPIAGIPGR